MKIAKGHYVPKELITSEAVHEAVVKCFVAAGFETKSNFGQYNNPHDNGLCVSILTGNIIWGAVGETCDTALTLQQLFTADNGLRWPTFATEIRTDDNAVWFFGGGQAEHICGHVHPIPHRVLATRQPKEKEVKSIEDAVIHFNGKWPCPSNSILRYYPEGGGKFTPYWVSNGALEVGEFICNHQKFEDTAKRLGFINSYRWGIEYPTNGKRPELADDVEVEIFSNDDCRWSERRVIMINWDAATIIKFRVTDARLQPADASYLNALTQAQSLTHSEEGLTHIEWWDYENDRAIADCPTDSQVEVVEDRFLPISEFGKSFLGQKCVVKATFKNKHGFSMVSVEKPDGECCCFALKLIRPLDHATRKAELERKCVVDAAVSAAQNFDNARSVSEALYDAGMLVIPK